MRLIDADRLIEAITINPVECPGRPEPEWAEEMVDLIDAMPTAEPELATNLQQSCNQLATDTISRQAAIDALAKAMPPLTTPDGSGQFDHDIQIADEAFVDCMQIINDLSSAEPSSKRGWYQKGFRDGQKAQQDMKRSFAEYVPFITTWLMDYQVRAAELKGRYTAYEVLGWVVNDWMKENPERPDEP